MNISAIGNGLRVVQPALAPVALLVSLGLFSAGMEPHGTDGSLALLGLLIAILLAVLLTVRLARAERAAIRLCADEVRVPRTLSAALAIVEHRLSVIGHRSDAHHPATNLATREHLFAQAAGGGLRDGALLAVLRLHDYDRLAAFDPASARELLMVCAKRLSTAIGNAHLLVQIDRDTLAVLFRAANPEEARSELRALRYVISQRLLLGGMTVEPVIRCGTATSSGENDHIEQLLARALADMAAETDVPAAGSASGADTIEGRFLLEQGLVQAIGERELSAVFQPIVDLSAGRVIGAEALIRWNHPRLGQVPPSRFMPIAESLGLSDPLGIWMLERACHAVRNWRNGGLTHMKVSVNLSACQLFDEALPAKIQRVLERHGVPATALELELTETAAMADLGRTRALFSAMHGIGIAIAIDDFGAGYSSLSYLKKLRFDKLKIDREFITDIERRRDSQAICKALIELGRGLDLAVLAEGVETEAEAAMLHTLGCTLFQGYHFSRPVDEHAMAALARRTADVAGLQADPITDNSFKDRVSA